MTDTLIDHLVTQNEKLLDRVLEFTRMGTPVNAEAVVGNTTELEQELAEADRTITKLRTEAADYNILRDTLFKEREDNREEVTSLKAKLDLAETQTATLNRQISEYEAQEAQVVQRFNQMQAELERAQANATDLNKTDRANVLRLLDTALEKFDDDPDGAFANINRARATIVGSIENDKETEDA